MTTPLLGISLLAIGALLFCVSALESALFALREHRIPTVAGSDDGLSKRLRRLLASKEGVIADRVYEGRAIRGLMNLADEGRFEDDAKILLMHLGGSPAVHAYAGHFGSIELTTFSA